MAHSQNALAWLQQWIQTQPHTWWAAAWLKIATLDNPGWMFEASLPPSSRARISKNYREPKDTEFYGNWITYKCNEQMFSSYGDTGRLVKILHIFQCWAENQPCSEDFSSDEIDWLSDWRSSQCDGDWEHCYGIKIETLAEPGWRVQIEITETYLEGQTFEPIDRRISTSDWLSCQIKREKSHEIFEGFGDLGKLLEILRTFKTWALNFEDIRVNYEGPEQQFD